MIKVGNKVVVLNEIILCPIGEFIDVDVTIPNESDPTTLRLQFIESTLKENEESKPLPIFYPDPDETQNDLWAYVFKDWNNSLGSSLSHPIPIGLSNAGETIYLLAEVAKLKSFYKLNIQVMLEVLNNG